MMRKLGMMIAGLMIFASLFIGCSDEVVAVPNLDILSEKYVEIAVGDEYNLEYQTDANEVDVVISGEGGVYDKGTRKFTSSKAGRYELVIRAKNSDEKFVSDKVVVVVLEEWEMDKYYSYSEVVDRMTDLRLLATGAASGEKCLESSAYEKTSRYNEATGQYENWGANNDRGHDLAYVGGEMTIAEMQGAGAIVRIWSAEPMDGLIRIYIDDNPNPVIQTSFKNLFGIGSEPFNLQQLCYDAARGKNCYVPITFNSYCKVTLGEGWGNYYQINYIMFDSQYEAEPFSMPLSSQNLQALKRVDDFFADNQGENPVEYTNTEKTSKTVSIAAESSIKILDKNGAGAVTALKVKINNLTSPEMEWDALAELFISAKWDKNANPAIYTTLGGFFASITGLNEYSSLPLGVNSDGTMYSYWYMPFDSGADISIINNGDSAYSISYEIETEKLDYQKAKTLLRFHAKWNRATDSSKNSNNRWPDSQFLYTKGKGRFVGTSLHIYKEIGTGDLDFEKDWWWGEGDEKFFVDGEKFPSWFGTGTEDYFGYAWGTWNKFSRPYHSQPFTNGGMFGIGNRLNNRFHIIDSVPFNESFDGYFEKYHRDAYSNWVFTNYWYLEKGGEDNYSPVSKLDATSYYSHPYPMTALSFIEGEDLKIIESHGMLKAETQDMRVFAGYTWSNDHQFILKSDYIDGYVKFWIRVDEAKEYKFEACFTKAIDFGIAQHYINGIKIGGEIDLYATSVSKTDDMLLGSIYLDKGLHVFEVKITGKNPLSRGFYYGLDYIKMT